MGDGRVTCWCGRGVGHPAVVGGCPGDLGAGIRAVPGRKDDQEKARFDLLPPRALEEVVAVLTFGAKEYAPDNWHRVQGARWRYFGALMRHSWAWWRGEIQDPKSGRHHLAHAACCLLFLLGFELGDVAGGYPGEGA